MSDTLFLKDTVFMPDTFCPIFSVCPIQSLWTIKSSYIRYALYVQYTLYVCYFTYNIICRIHTLCPILSFHIGYILDVRCTLCARCNPSRYTVCPIHAFYFTLFMSEIHRDSSTYQNVAVNNRDSHGDSSEYDNESYRHARTFPQLVLSPSFTLPSMPRSVKCTLSLLLPSSNVIYFQTSSTSFVSSPLLYCVKFVKLCAFFSLALLMIIYKCSPQHFDLWHLRFAQGSIFRMSICRLWRRVLSLLCVFFQGVASISGYVAWVSLNSKRHRGRRSGPDWCLGIVLSVLRKTKNHRSRTGRVSNQTSLEPYFHANLFCL